jgi:hypothetical protein
VQRGHQRWSRPRARTRRSQLWEPRCKPTHVCPDTPKIKPAGTVHVPEARQEGSGAFCKMTGREGKGDAVGWGWAGWVGGHHVAQASEPPTWFLHLHQHLQALLRPPLSQGPLSWHPAWLWRQPLQQLPPPQDAPLPWPRLLRSDGPHALQPTACLLGWTGPGERAAEAREPHSRHDGSQPAYQASQNQHRRISRPLLAPLDQPLMGDHRLPSTQSASSGKRGRVPPYLQHSPLGSNFSSNGVHVCLGVC